MGSTTLRNEAQQAGGDPDESYCIDTDKAIPDLVIEVIVTSGSINRLKLYHRLGVAEVWFWYSDHLTIYHRREDIPTQWADRAGYERISISELLANLDIDLLARCLQNPNPLVAAQLFHQGPQSQGSIHPELSKHARKLAGVV